TSIFDSTVICEYLEDTHPTPSLHSSDPKLRARARLITQVVDTHLEAVPWGMNEVVVFGRAQGELKAKLLKEAKEQIEGWYKWLDTQLGGDEYFGGSVFGFADCAVVPHINSCTSFGVPPPPNTALASWWSRVLTRPSVKKVLEEAKSERHFMKQVAGTLQKGMMKREYRDHRLEWMIKSGGIEVVVDGLKKGNIRFTDHTAFANSKSKL
ncbi:hypothetical protein HK104_004274, partial [Borealophlyctis nickersoniae]